MARSIAGASAAKSALRFLADFAAPYLIYTATRSSLGDVHALLAASAPPIAWSAIEFVCSRRVDALSLLVAAGILLSLVALAGGGGVRFLQLREQLVVAVIGVAFLGSVAIGRPLIYALARARMRRRSGPEAQAFEAMRDSPVLRRAMTIMTVVWGVALLVDAAVCCGLAFALPIARYLLIAPILSYGALAILTAWTFWYARRRIAAARAPGGGVAGR